MGTIGNIMGGSGLKELFANIYAENSIDNMMSGRSYARAVRAHTLFYLALAQEVVITIDLTAEETFVIENLLSDCDKSKILKVHENEKILSIITKFHITLQKLVSNGPTAKL